MSNDLLNARIKDFLSYSESTLSVNSCKTYGIALSRFLSWFINNESQVDCTEQDLIDYQLTLADIKPNSQYKYIQVLKQFFTWLFDTGRIDTNPAVRLKVKVQKKLAKAFTQEQVIELVQLLPETDTGTRDKAMVSLAYNACLRREELMNISMSDIHLFNREISLRVSKNKKQRIAVFSRWSLSYLYDYLKVRESILDGGNSPWLWLNRFGEQLSYNAIEELTKRVKALDDTYQYYSLHKLRHSISTEIARHTDHGNIGLISEHLGHSQLDTSYQHYINFNIEDLKKLIDDNHHED